MHRFSNRFHNLPYLANYQYLLIVHGLCTGLLDPSIEVRPATGQVDDCLEELRFEDAARFRDLMRYYQNLEMLKAD